MNSNLGSFSLSTVVAIRNGRTSRRVISVYLMMSRNRIVSSVILLNYIISKKLHFKIMIKALVSNYTVLIPSG